MFRDSSATLQQNPDLQRDIDRLAKLPATTSDRSFSYNNNTTRAAKYFTAFMVEYHPDVPADTHWTIEVLLKYRHEYLINRASSCLS